MYKSCQSSKNFPAKYSRLVSGKILPSLVGIYICAYTYQQCLYTYNMYMHIRIRNVCMYTNIYKYICAKISNCSQLHTYIYICIYISIYIYMYIDRYVCIHTFILIYIYTYLNKYIYIHIYIYI